MAKEVTPEQIAQIDEMVARAHTALDIIATYDQQRVDRLCQAVAAAVCDMRSGLRYVTKPLTKPLLAIK